MIIQCESCSRKFVAKDSDIPEEGRMVQCGYCSVTWHQMPVSIPTKILKQPEINKPAEEINEGLSVDSIKASDGKTYKFLGSQWAQLLPSGKTGLFAKRKIGKELDKLTGRKEKIRTLRQGGGISGFTKRQESEYDPFGAAHSSTSISSALGIIVLFLTTSCTSLKIATGVKLLSGFK